jgi:hypothetical protein
MPLNDQQMVSICLLSLWKSMNECCWNNILEDVSHVIYSATSVLQDCIWANFRNAQHNSTYQNSAQQNYADQNLVNRMNNAEESQWHIPGLGYLKFYIDCSFFQRQQMIGCASVLRDHHNSFSMA